MSLMTLESEAIVVMTELADEQISELVGGKYYPGYYDESINGAFIEKNTNNAYVYKSNNTSINQQNVSGGSYGSQKNKTKQNSW